MFGLDVGRLSGEKLIEAKNFLNSIAIKKERNHSVDFYYLSNLWLVTCYNGKFMFNYIGDKDDIDFNRSFESFIDNAGPGLVRKFAYHMDLFK